MLHRLNRYIFLKSLSGMVIAFLGVSASVIMVDLVEQSRAVAGIQNANFFTALKFTLMRLPGLTEQSIPITALVGTLLSFTGLSRRSEITAMRAAGVSAWRFLAPLGWLAVFIGVAVTFFIDPISAKLNDQYEAEKDRLSSIVQIADASKSTKSLWVTLPSTEGQLIIYGDSKEAITQNSFAINNATIYVYDKSGLNLQKTIDAKLAIRKNKQLIISDAYTTHTGSQSEFSPSIQMGLSNTTSIEGTREPRIVPLWELPAEAHLAKQNGGSPEKYWLRFFRLLMLPFNMLAMVLFAAIMSIGLDRSGGKIRSVMIAIAIGISMYFFNEIAGLMASSGNIPGLIAAICPPVFTLALTLALISYREDGQVS